MGTMADTSMPMGLTFAGRAYDDAALLQLATAFEATGRYRAPPPRTPDLPAPPVIPPADALAPTLSAQRKGDSLTLTASAPILWASVDGQPVPGLPATSVTLRIPDNTHRPASGCGPTGPLVVALFAEGQGASVTC